MVKRTTHVSGLRILFGPKYWLWNFDESKLSFVTPYFLSHQVTKFAKYLYYEVLKLKKDDPAPVIWDMFGGIGTDSVYLSQHFSVITTEINPEVFQILKKNIKAFNLTNVNIIQDNCLSVIGYILPKVIYYDPPWGEAYKPKIKNFDFNHVYIDCPTEKNELLPDLPKKVNSVDLAKFLFKNVTKNIIIKSPMNSYSFEYAFNNNIFYIYKYPNKNLKFIFVVADTNIIKS